jgi:hypothetical protein
MSCMNRLVIPAFGLPGELLLSGPVAAQPDLRSGSIIGRP